jgi:hypothetical protein
MSEDRRLPWLALLIVLATLAISLLLTARLAFLNFFYLPVLLVAYWSGRRTAVLVAVLCLVLVGFLAVLFPEQFNAPGAAEGPISAAASTHLVVWGCFLVLAGYAAGTFMERLRGRASRQPARPEVQLYNIGTLAIIKGYLRHDQVLKILQIQQRSDKRFGEIAVGLRLLKPEQVDELLRLQQEKRSVTSSEIAMAKLELSKARKGSAAAPREP